MTRPIIALHSPRMRLKLQKKCVVDMPELEQLQFIVIIRQPVYHFEPKTYVFK